MGREECKLVKHYLLSVLFLGLIGFVSQGRASNLPKNFEILTAEKFQDEIVSLGEEFNFELDVLIYARSIRSSLLPTSIFDQDYDETKSKNIDILSKHGALFAAIAHYLRVATEQGIPSRGERKFFSLLSALNSGDKITTNYKNDIIEYIYKFNKINNVGESDLIPFKASRIQEIIHGGNRVAHCTPIFIRDIESKEIYLLDAEHLFWLLLSRRLNDDNDFREMFYNSKTLFFIPHETPLFQIVDLLLSESDIAIEKPERSFFTVQKLLLEKQGALTEGDRALIKNIMKEYSTDSSLVGLREKLEAIILELNFWRLTPFWREIAELAGLIFEKFGAVSQVEALKNTPSLLSGNELGISDLNLLTGPHYLTSDNPMIARVKNKTRFQADIDALKKLPGMNGLLFFDTILESLNSSSNFPIKKLSEEITIGNCSQGKKSLLLERLGSSLVIDQSWCQWILPLNDLASFVKAEYRDLISFFAPLWRSEIGYMLKASEGFDKYSKFIRLKLESGDGFINVFNSPDPMWLEVANDIVIDVEKNRRHRESIRAALGGLDDSETALRIINKLSKSINENIRNSVAYELFFYLDNVIDTISMAVWAPSDTTSNTTDLINAVANLLILMGVNDVETIGGQSALTFLSDLNEDRFFKNPRFMKHMIIVAKEVKYNRDLLIKLAEIAGKIGGYDAVALLEELSTNNNVDVLVAVAWALRDAGKTATKALERLYQNGDETVRSEAKHSILFQRLSDNPTHSALEELAREILILPDVDRTFDLRLLLAKKIAMNSPFFLSLISDDNPLVAQSASFRLYEEEPGIELLESLKNHEDYYVRMCVALGARKVGVKKGLPILRVLAKDVDKNVRREVVTSLGELAYKDVYMSDCMNSILDILETMVDEDPDTEVKRNAKYKYDSCKEKFDYEKNH